ncbi:MAG: Hsp20/alpha crystallin family protein [Candidatus Gastranaerophilales bacterium]|nr:Hsp20/alpha crystallin family protein [Candidatus Gastranaerophilales bacterium]
MNFLVRRAPENFIRTVNDEISSLLNRHFDSYFPEANYWEENETKFSIPIEVSDKGKTYELKAELPGIKKENLDIDIDSNYVIVNAKKEEEKKTQDHNYTKTELKYGEFSRTIYLPEEIDTKKAEAELKDGILTISAPKKESMSENKKKLTVK